jgi:serine/threonine protein kinase
MPNEQPETVQCEHCGQLHGEEERLCPQTGKLFRPERIFPPGTLLGGKYRLGKVLGSGGMGAVFEAQHTLLQKRVAIKLMIPEMAEDRELLARMVREARTASATGHRNIVLVTDMGWEGNAPYLAMEHLEGVTIRQLIRERRQIPEQETSELIEQVLSGLEVVHARDIVHRDLKPDNIMVVEDEEGNAVAKLLDFGISKVLGADKRFDLTQTGHLLGSPRYMSPEQARGDKAIDQRSDIYSVGTVLYQMLTGKPPHEAKTFPQMIAAILRHDVVPPSRKFPGISAKMDAVALKALHRDPSQRFQHAASFRAALREAHNGASSNRPSLSLSSRQHHDSMEVTTPSVATAGATPSSLAGRGNGTQTLGTGDLEPASSTASAGSTQTVGTEEIESLRLATLVDAEPPSAEQDPSIQQARAPAPAQIEHNLAPVSLQKPSDDAASLELDRDGAWQQSYQRPATAAAPRPSEPTKHAGAYLGTGRASSQAMLKLIVAALLVACFAALGWSQRARIRGWFGGQPAAADHILIVVRCRPATSRVYLDGVYQVSTSIKLPREERSYQLRVSAPGYFSESRAITADKTQVIEVRLKRKRQRN